MKLGTNPTMDFIFNLSTAAPLLLQMIKYMLSHHVCVCLLCTGCYQGESS